MKDLKKSLSKKWYKSKAFMIGGSIASVGVVATAVAVPVALSLNKEGSSVNGPLEESKPQLTETEIKLNKLNSQLSFDQKVEIINKYLNHNESNGKTPVDLLADYFVEKPKNILDFILDNFYSIKSWRGFDQYLSNFFATANDDIIQFSTEKFNLLKNFSENNDPKVFCNIVNDNFSFSIWLGKIKKENTDISFVYEHEQIIAKIQAKSISSYNILILAFNSLH